MESLYTGSSRKWVLGGQETAARSYPGNSSVLERLLYDRGIQTRYEMERFLSPELSQLHDPFLLKGMDGSVERILRAIENHESILIYGDYDVDGVTATSIMVRFLRKMGVKADFYIPGRVEEGYGISDAAVAYISRSSYGLMITVDCGITARVQVAAIREGCRNNGHPIDIIITDHHQTNDELVPEAYAVIDPHLADSGYPFKQLCGAGISLKLVQAVGIRLGQPGLYEAYLDLAALATIADIVDLNDENRVITKYGIKRMKESCCVGLQALFETAGIQCGNIDSNKISYALAPRINAAGRMGDAKRAVLLLTTDDRSEAASIALELEKSNAERQEVQETIYIQAAEAIDSDHSYRSERVIVAHGEGWHHGVVGIVASKLVERYRKPAFVISTEGNKAVGSGRSIEGFNLFQALEAQSDLLIKFGGHSQAGGLTLQTMDIGIFRNRINEYAAQNMPDSVTQPLLNVHCMIGHAEINMKTAKQLCMLEPYGQGNVMPALLVKNVAVIEKKIIGNGKHLKLKVGLNQQSVDAVYFGKGDMERYIRPGDRLDIVFNLDINFWQNAEFLQLRVIDMRLEEKTVSKNRFLMEAAKRFELLACDDEWLYNGIKTKLVAFDDVLVTREDLAAVYRYMLKEDIASAGIADLFWHASRLAEACGRNINFYKFILALFIFDELALLGVSLRDDGRYVVEKYEGQRKVNLEESELYSYLQETMRNCG